MDPQSPWQFAYFANLSYQVALGVLLYSAYPGNVQSFCDRHNLYTCDYRLARTPIPQWREASLAIGLLFSP